MSTERNNISAKRISILLSHDEKIFHARDLANLWLIQNKNTLYTILKRYTKAKIFHRIYKGLYSLLPLEKLDPIHLGAKALHQFCYLTTETILFQEGYISQKVTSSTFVSEKSLTFQIGPYRYKSRQLNAKFLYHTADIIEKNRIKIATPERAIADMLYFNPHYHFDRKINWRKIQRLQKNIGYPLTYHRYEI